MRRGLLLAAFACAAWMSAARVPLAQGAAPAPQGGALELRITSPTANALLSGPVKLAAEVRPPDRAGEVTRVAFFVDGREVCVVAEPPFECEWDAGRDVVAHVVRAVAVLDDGRRLSKSVRTRGLGYVDKVSVDAVQLAVVVTDDAGRFVQKLPRTAFRVYEDDVPQTMTTFASEDIPLELVAALDVSQSMTDAMDALKDASKTFLTSLRAHERVTLLAFNDNIFTLSRRTTAAQARLRAIDRLAPWGGTALFDVIIRGIDLLGRQTGRRALVLFSDGEDQSSRASQAAAVQSVEASDATVYAIGLGRGSHVPALRGLLDRLATLSGGRGIFMDDDAGLQRAFAEIVEDLSHQYLVGYQPSNQKRDGAWRRIRVEVTGKYTVRHRQGFRLMPDR